MNGWRNFLDRASVYTNYMLLERLKRHLNWTKDPFCRSPMISTFGSEAHARNWARRFETRLLEQYCICHIDVSSTYKVFSAAELATVLDIPLDPSKKKMLRDEYLIMRHIYDSDIGAFNVNGSGMIDKYS